MKTHTLSVMACSLVIGAFSLISTPATARTLHAILSSVTGDSERSYDRQLDLDGWIAMFKDVAGNKVDITVEQHVLKGADCSANGIKNACNALTVGPDDAIFFAYNGHGFTNPNQQLNKWPALALQNEGDRTNLDLAAIYQMLAGKKPRLLVVTADTCSSVWTKGKVPPVPGIRGKDLASQHYAELFITAKGNYLSSGSEPGQFTWTMSNGSIYTNTLRGQIKTSVHTDSADVASWDSIFSAVCGRDLVEGMDMPWESTPAALRKQVPQFEKNPVIKAGGN